MMVMMARCRECDWMEDERWREDEDGGRCEVSVCEWACT